MSKVRTAFGTSTIEIETPDSSAFDIYRVLDSAFKKGGITALSKIISERDLQKAVKIKPLEITAP